MKKRFIKLTKNITIITLILSNLIAVYCADYPTYEEGMAAGYIGQDFLFFERS